MVNMTVNKIYERGKIKSALNSALNTLVLRYSTYIDEEKLIIFINFSAVYGNCESISEIFL